MISVKPKVKEKEDYLFEYVDRLGKLSFSEFPFNVVDAMIFSILSYYRFDFMSKAFLSNLTIRKAAEIYFKDDNLLSLSSNKYRNPFLVKLMYANRYKDLELFNFVRDYDPKEDKQFEAICIKLSKKTCFISFSGTDSTLAGIKEDLDMSYNAEIPSQEKSEEYILNKNLSKFEKIYLGGHSKGGSLAIYSAFSAPHTFKTKISKVFNFDGPGFINYDKDKKDNASLVDKIITIVPEMSLIGMIMNDMGNTLIIESDSYLIHQHNVFCWKINEYNRFIPVSYVSKSSNIFNRTINEYMKEVNIEDREKIVNSLWEIVKASDVTSIQELKDNIAISTLKVGQKLMSLTKEEKKYMKSNVHGILKILIAQLKFVQENKEGLSTFNWDDLYNLDI